MKKISIVIVTHNSEDLIEDCLNSIFINNDIGEELEIIIVDNQSKNVDQMFSLIENKFGKDVLLVKNSKNGGYGQGNNVGILQAKAPVILIMNPDVRLLQPSFKQVLHYFENPRIVMLGMKQMISQHRVGLSFATERTFSPTLNVILTWFCNKIQLYNQKLMYFAGACFFIRKSKFEKIGLFDENFFMYQEENDIHYRLLKESRNNKFIYVKSLKYIHLVEDRELEIKPLNVMYNSQLLFCRKNGMNVKKMTKGYIRQQHFFILIESIRMNKKKKLFHKDLLEFYKNRLKQIYQDE